MTAQTGIPDDPIRDAIVRANCWKRIQAGTQGHLVFARTTYRLRFCGIIGGERVCGSIALLGFSYFYPLSCFERSEARDKVGSLIVIGVLALLLFHIVINLGMVVGFLPIIGIPLPF